MNFKNLSFFLTFFTILCINCAEDNSPKQKYQIVDSPNGVYRLNTENGEIVLFGKNGIKKYDDQYIERKYKQDISLNDITHDESKCFPGSHETMWTQLSYKWSNGKVIYKYSFGPYSEQLDKVFKQANSSLEVRFVDKDGFRIADFVILLNSLTIMVDRNGSGIQWEVEGELPCTKNDYKLINSYATEWSFSNSVKAGISAHSRRIKVKNSENIRKIMDHIKNGKIVGGIAGDKCYVQKNTRYQNVNDLRCEDIDYIANNPEIYRLNSQQEKIGPFDEKDAVLIDLFGSLKQ